MRHFAERALSSNSGPRAFYLTIIRVYDSIRVAQPIRLQHLHQYTIGILLITDRYRRHFRSLKECGFSLNPAFFRRFKAGFHQRRSRSRNRSRSGKRTYDLVTIGNRCRKRSHKLDGMGVGRIHNVTTSSDSVYDSVAYELVKTTFTKLEVKAEEPTNHKAPNGTL